MLRLGGDTILPLAPHFAMQNAFDWIDFGNGAYYSTDVGIWVGMFYALESIGFDLYTSAFRFFQLLIFFSSLV
ncbi:MAG: hypothetical protein UZ21_OP11001001060 [Microgenomates bacterium OLB22]|nr:MAG: hypothetical protein UZ21_OP11001001060 [Microgenomates bacterium OLB22]